MSMLTCVTKPFACTHAALHVSPGQNECGSALEAACILHISTSRRYQTFLTTGSALRQWAGLDVCIKVND